MMIFVIALLLGITVLELRSAAAVIFVAISIPVIFGAAEMATGGAVSWSELAFAMVGYNVSFLSLVVKAIFARRHRHSLH